MKAFETLLRNFGVPQYWLQQENSLLSFLPWNINPHLKTSSCNVSRFVSLASPLSRGFESKIKNRKVGIIACSDYMF